MSQKSHDQTELKYMTGSLLTNGVSIIFITHGEWSDWNSIRYVFTVKIVTMLKIYHLIPQQCEPSHSKENKSKYIRTNTCSAHKTWRSYFKMFAFHKHTCFIIPFVHNRTIPIDNPMRSPHDISYEAAIEQGSVLTQYVTSV